MNYKENDYELLYMIKEENEEAKELFYDKYKPLVEMKAQKFYEYVKNKGYELNDLIQEGMIGLSNAINDYEENKDIKFITFANVCIERQLLNFLRDINRHKHQVLNTSVSIDAENKGGITLLDILNDDNNPSPEDTFMLNEEQKELKDEIKEVLTEKEKEVFDLRYEGFTYQEIARLLNMSKKAVDGTISRIKQKIINTKKYID